jgi:hypothetical protein
MANLAHNYHFDEWAEFLTVTLADNISRCQLGHNKIKKVRLTLHEQSNWPVTFKVILDNELIAAYPNKQALHDGSYGIDHLYNTPSAIPYGSNETDLAAKLFINQAKQLDPNFLSDNWSLRNKHSIPALMRQLAFRSMCSLMPIQLKHQGIDLSEDFSLQFFDGSNYLSFSYDAIKQAILEQSSYYLGNNAIKEAAANTCFKHNHNKSWFMQLS